MSDNIPFEIQIEIIKNLPIKSLVQFRTVSKPWKFLIDSSKFNADYTSRHAQRQHLFIMYEGDITFYYRAVVWNPSIRKSIVVDVPGKFHPDYTFLAFGVCPITSEPKIFKIRMMDKRGSLDVSWQVKVYTLSSWVWRTSFGNLPSKRILGIHHIYKVLIDGIIYWLAQRIDMHKVDRLIMSFNLESEEFKEIYIPNKLATTSDSTFNNFLIFELRESLALVGSKIMDHKQFYEVWIVEDGESKSFTKIYTIKLPYDGHPRLLGFRKNDQLIMETQVGITDPIVISVYEPCSRNTSTILEYMGNGILISPRLTTWNRCFCLITRKLEIKEQLLFEH